MIFEGVREFSNTFLCSTRTELQPTPGQMKSAQYFNTVLSFEKLIAENPINFVNYKIKTITIKQSTYNY